MIERIKQYPYLLQSLLSYLILGCVDTIHHLHAALALGHNAAMHAVWAGVVLVPSAVITVVLFVRIGNRLLLWGFAAIALLATLVPGIYHGGWDHLVKVLAFLRIDSDATKLMTLFPSDNLNFWFYEISGTLEFGLAIVSGYFLYKLLLVRP